MNIEEIATIYFNPDAIRVQPYKIGRVSFGDGRAYFKFQLPAKIYTSLTTVTSTCSPMPYGIMKWKMDLGEKESARVGRVAAMYGTLMHETIGDFCIKQSFDFDKTGDLVSDYLSKHEFYDNDTHEWTNRLKEDMQAWADFVYRHKVNVIAVEMVLCSDQFEFATAIDIVCEMTIEEKGFYGEVYKSGDKKDQPKESKKESRIRAIINLKSGRKSFYQENANQLELEHMVWKENYPDIKIDKIYNWAPTEWRETSGEKWRLKDQTGLANKVEMEAMLMLASERYKGKNEQKMYTNIFGEVYYGNDPTANISQIKVIEHLEKRIKKYLEGVN